MQNIGIGDVIFILLVLGIIHGIMFWVGSRKKRRNRKTAATASADLES